MKRADYVKLQASILKKLCDQRDKKTKCRLMESTSKKAKKIDVDLNWLGMQIEQTKERIAFALSFLSPEDARKEYFPSEFHRYPGIREELEGLNFED